MAEDIASMGPAIVAATVDIYQAIKRDLLPTPAKSHYTYNMRDLSKVFQGIAMVGVGIDTPEKMTRYYLVILLSAIGGLSCLRSIPSFSALMSINWGAAVICLLSCSACQSACQSRRVVFCVFTSSQLRWAGNLQIIA